MTKKWKYLKTREKVRVKVDEDDYERLLMHTWKIITSSSGKRSVVTSIRFGDKVKLVTLGKFLLDPPEGKQVYPRRFNDALDYRRENLIVCTMQERQTMIPKLKKRGTSIYRGVSYISSKDSWRSRIEFDGKRIYLGDFKSEEAAALAYNEASLKYFGNQGYQNRIREKNLRKRSKKKKK
ncbi:MAG: hypothetical protein CL678_18435 [Bdellovibrionaceae bacterium]|nr:hypothetical protein [Pseudobdellovibrionaceae bacterium]|tara:strand:+ start:1999 stop:2538 length:540 start_codon:yes stop_codon:yes gene_type:complete